MFFIFNKQKIYSYIVAASTVVILFILSFFFIKTDVKVTETSANTTNEIENTNNLSSINNKN